ncbi:MAG: hypothetical protein L0I76_26805 [Pseudonocardia sp.]|nr:hypothetical protein [Pseudonocardia sp.]
MSEISKRPSSGHEPREPGGSLSIPQWQIEEILGTEHEVVFELTDHQEIRRYLDDHGLHYHVISEEETTEQRSGTPCGYHDSSQREAAQRLRRLFGGG